MSASTNRKACVRREVLCETRAGNSCFLVSVTNFGESQREREREREADRDRAKGRGEQVASQPRRKGLFPQRGFMLDSGCRLLAIAAFLFLTPTSVSHREGRERDGGGRGGGGRDREREREGREREKWKMWSEGGTWLMANPYRRACVRREV